MPRFNGVPVEEERKPRFRGEAIEVLQKAESDGMMDVIKSGASGMARGAMELAGLPGTLSDLFDTGVSAALRKGYEFATGDKPSSTGGAVERFFAQELPKNPLSGQTIRKFASDTTGGATEYQPKTTAGKYASTIGEFLPGAAAFGGGSIGSMLRFGALPGAASETAGQMTEGSRAEPYARIAAALAAPAVPALASRAVTPFRIDPSRAKAAQVLRSEGVSPTAGQVTGSRGLRYRESELGGGKAAQMMEDQAEAFTSAALRRAGGSGRATSENMAAINQRLGRGFEEISSRNNLVLDRSILDDISGTIREYGRLLPSEQRRIVNNLAQDIVEKFRKGNGIMSGRDYQTARSRLTKRVKNATGRDNELADAYRGLRDALDDGMSRSVGPEDAARWAELRREWGNLKTLERAAVGGGEDAALGLISPARLRMAAAMGRRGQYARGEGDFAELAKAGQTLLTPLPQSGTAPRLMARGLGAGVGAGAGAAAGNIPGAIAGAALGQAVPYVAGRTLMSRPVQGYLTNQLMTPQNIIDPRYAAIAQSLLANQTLPGGR